ncbi:hypothetical protein Pla100_35040 [Neorhodopirellula pilleata]|uniref:Uncharacterized protein n=1 Tax=Neorhodopirellula pilleata TaxID=2714738 RepID=A0A5C6A6M0_9BACT|nr:hypothetical protein Pla100_35040 [Neorhodopirellula pilleata]
MYGSVGGVPGNRAPIPIRLVLATTAMSASGTVDMSPQDDLGDPLHIAYQPTGCNIRLQQSVDSSPVGSSNRKRRFPG